MTSMVILAVLIVGLGIGYAVGASERARKKELELTLMLNLSATEPVKINVLGKDSEGNAVDLSSYELKLEVEGTNEKNFGELNDELDTFNPGEAGATGVIRGSVTVDDVTYSTGDVAVELIAGGLAEIALDFTPAPATTEGEGTVEGGEGTPPADPPVED